MAILYAFFTEDGEEINRFFPIGQCPNQIVLDDGRIAKRSFKSNVSMFTKQGSSGSNASKLNNEMKKRNEEAGKRMKERWKSVKNN